MKKMLLVFMIIITLSSFTFAELKGIYLYSDDPNIPEGSVEYYLACIEQLNKLKQFKFAEEYYSEAKEKYPTNIDILLSYGDILYYQGDAQGEFNYYSELLKKYPEEYKIYVKRSYCDRDLDLSNQYIEDLLLANKYHENDSDILGDLGLGYLEVEDFKNAEIYLMKSINVDSKKTKTLNNLASLNFQTNNYEKALEWANKSLEINDQNSYTYRLLGYIYKALGKEEESENAFSKVKYSN